MTVQQYFVVENNVVINTVMWDGNTQDWQPPADATMLVSETTLAMVWKIDKATNEYVLKEIMGVGQIGFTWDGTVLTTNEPQPPKPSAQPTSNGTVTA